MSQNLGSITITSGVNTVFQDCPTMGAKAILIGNESGLTCTVTMQGGGVQKTLYPGTIDWFDIRQGFSGTILISPSSVLLNIASFPANTLIFDVIGLRDPEAPDMYPLTLPSRQTVTATATGNPVFSVTVGFGSTTGNRQKLNVYNPANSGVTMIFHSARVYDDNTGSPTANLALVSGADLNLANAVTITSHIGSAKPPTSAGHATWEEVGIQAIPGTTIEVMDLQAQVTQDFLDFPDTVSLAPGNNLLIDLAQSGTGHIVRLTMKWSEVPNNTIPTQVVNMATQSAANITNDGNAAGTGIIESTPSGQASSALHLTNDGAALFNILISGAYHQWLKTQTSGSPLVLGQAGDNTEVLGILLADSGINTNTIRDGTNGNTALDLSAGTGAVTFQKGLTVNGTTASLNGGTSGTATAWTVIKGTAGIITIVQLNNFKTAGANQSLSLPTAYASRALILATDTEAYQLNASGVGQGARQWTSFGAAGAGGGTSATTTQQGFNLFWLASGFDAIQFNSGWVTPRNGVILIIGL